MLLAYEKLPVFVHLKIGFSPHLSFSFGFTMDGINTVRRNKTAIETILCADYGLILNKVEEKKLITRREYNNLKGINKEDVWGHVVALVDKLMDKGDDTCTAFLNLLQTDEDIRNTYPELGKIIQPVEVGLFDGGR